MVNKFISFDYIRALILISFFIYSIYFFIYPQEAFAMDPEQEVFRYFDPNTYIRHELDGTPIYESGRAKCYSYNRETYALSHGDMYRSKSKIYELDSKPIFEIDSQPNGHLDPTSHRHELHYNPIDYQTLEGKLRYDLHKSRCLADKVRHQLYTEARTKQSSCGKEMPVYHKKVLDLPKTDEFSRDTSKCVFKRGNFLK
jgi:hypothetical protein